MNGANIGANIVCFRPSNCKRCTGRVYEAEKVVAASEVWHKCCFRCLRCGRSLEPGKFSDRAGEIYCNSREFLLVLKLSTQEAGIHYFWDNTKQLLCQEFSPKVQTDFAIMYTILELIRIYDDRYQAAFGPMCYFLDRVAMQKNSDLKVLAVA
uniref:LIM zinc-binding domain-containing protein n=1 Tax=Meloidogyne javanica TaxID=6303 RepID=A0A915M6Y5_MELJA